jgi:Domain of unknown function (DUF4158)
MPRRSILSATERDSLFTWPKTQEELIRHYTLSQTDLSIIRQHRGVARECAKFWSPAYIAHDTPYRNHNAWTS